MLYNRCVAGASGKWYVQACGGLDGDQGGGEPGYTLEESLGAGRDGSRLMVTTRDPCLAQHQAGGNLVQDKVSTHAPTYANFILLLCVAGIVRNGGYCFGHNDGELLHKPPS